MRQVLQNNLDDVDFIYRQVVNQRTNQPYSTPKSEWSIPLYYTWKVLRYDLGIDTHMPVNTISKFYGHPQEVETVRTLEQIKKKYYPEITPVEW